METQICLCLDDFLPLPVPGKKKRPDGWEPAIFGTAHQRKIQSTCQEKEIHIVISPIGTVTMNLWSFTDVLVALEEIAENFTIKEPKNIDKLFVTKVPIPKYYVCKNTDDYRIEISDNHWVLKYTDYNEKCSLLKNISAGQNNQLCQSEPYLNEIEWAILGTAFIVAGLNFYYVF